MVRERYDAIADDLPHFVTLARDQQHVAGRKSGNGFLDGLASVADFHRARRFGEDCRPDCRRTFAARVVIGDHNPVGILRRDPAHDRALAGVAVPAGAEDDDQFPACIGAQAFKRFLERIGLVRIVDEYRCAVMSPGKLEPSLGTHEFFHCRKHTRGLSTGRYRQSRGNAGILHLERADKWQTYFVCASGMQNRDDLIEAIDRRADELDVSALLSDSDDFQATFLCCFDNLVRIAIVDADNGRTTRRNQVLEQSEFGGEIGFDGGVP